MLPPRASAGEPQEGYFAAHAAVARRSEWLAHNRSPMTHAQVVGWLQAVAALSSMAVASTALIQARGRPLLQALAYWVLLGCCATFGVLPIGVCLLLAVAVTAVLAADRLPSGLAWALFAWSISIAVGWMLAVLPPEGEIPEGICHAAAVLAAWWMFAAVLARRWPHRWGADARSAFLMTSIAAGVAAVVMLIYAAGLVTIWRFRQVFVSVPIYLPSTAWGGLVDLGFVGLALAASRRVGRWPGLPTAAMWWAVFAGTWWGLMLPPWPEQTVSAWPGWLSWTVWIQTAWAWPLVVAVLWWVWGDWRAQERAWPGQMDQLTRISPPWPGLESSALIIGLVLVPTALWHAFWTGSRAHLVCLVTALDAAAVGVALSVLAGRRWTRAAGELALAVWSVAVAALFAVPAALVAANRPAIERLPLSQTGILLGLAFTAWLWHWLAGVWRQQINGTKAWTTTGRMVPLAERMGFMTASIAWLVGAKLAFWPALPYGTIDGSYGRLASASLAYGALVGACLYASWRTGKLTLLWLAGLSAGIWGVFFWWRLHG